MYTTLRSLLKRMSRLLNENYFDYDSKLMELREEFLSRYENKNLVKKESIKNFKFTKVLGEGAFGVVKLAKNEQSEEVSAVKILKKDTVMRKKHLNHVSNERKILAAMSYEFVINLKYTMQDNSYIYMGMEFVNGGEMFTIMRRFGKFVEELARFYASQVVLGLEYIHRMGLVYRDLKPENILLDRNGYLKITDFGFAKMLKDDSLRTYTLCGTPEYIAPEIINNHGYGQAVDWWSLGILIYEFSAGYSPFYAQNQMHMMEKIVAGKYKVPSSFSQDLKSIISNLVQCDLSKRFGNLKNGPADIKNHVWFKLVNFDALYLQKIEPPYIPKVSDSEDYSQFEDFNDVVLRVSDTNKHEEQFADF